MLHEMINKFNSAFIFPSAHTWVLIFLAIAIGIVFGTIWLSLFWPPLFKKPWPWVVFIVSAFLTWAAISFIQIPLQTWTRDIGNNLWNPDKLSYINLVLVVGIPVTLISGIVQEAGKMVPILFYWWRNHRILTPKFGLIIGAVSGAGFGIFEAIEKININAPYSWNWSTVGINGVLSGLSSVIFHTSSAALVGYGLAKHKGWLFYLIAAFLHGLGNYSIVLISVNRMTSNQQIVWMGAITVLIGIMALWLRWHKTKEIASINSADILPDTTPQAPIS